ncbi:MAG: methyltransferase domain-containing protein [Ruminococcaceae bacterium]|nr:methyltransferase domain-containing protein [Oscillospiraceae bacterium]
MKWDAEKYLRFEKQRTQPSRDLAARISDTEAKRVLDVGCGPGNSTAVLQETFPAAAVTGCDFSEEMLEKARATYGDRMEFLRCDASCELPQLGRGWDVVFSNACIQWLPDHRKVLSDMMSLLRPGGALAVQIPYNFSEPIHTVICERAAQPEWQAKLGGEVRSYGMLTTAEYCAILQQLTTDWEVWLTSYMHILPSYEAILDWYRGTGLRPYLALLDEADGQRFEQEVLEGIKKGYTQLPDGSVLFPFPRLFLLAHRTT